MQFHHPHAFRAQVVEALHAELPEVWCGLLAAGAQPITVPAGARPSPTAPPATSWPRWSQGTPRPVGTDAGHAVERGRKAGQAAGSTLPRWSHSVRPSRNRTPSAHRASTAPPANCSV